MSLSSSSHHTPKESSIHPDSLTSISSSVSFGSTFHKTKQQSATLRNTAHQLLNSEERGILKHVMRIYRQNNSLDSLCISLAKIINTQEKVKLIDIIHDMFPEEMGKDFLRRCETHISLYAMSIRMNSKGNSSTDGANLMPIGATLRSPVSQMNRTTSLTGFASMRVNSKLRETGSFWDIQRRNGPPSNTSSQESNDNSSQSHPLTSSEVSKKFHTNVACKIGHTSFMTKRFVNETGKTSNANQEAVEASMKNFETIADRVTRQTSKERPRLSNLQDMGFWDESKLEKKPHVAHNFLNRRVPSAQANTLRSTTRTVSTANIHETRRTLSGATSPLPSRSAIRKVSIASTHQTDQESVSYNENHLPLPLPTATTTHSLSKKRIPSATRATSTDCSPSYNCHIDSNRLSPDDTTSSTIQRRVIFHPQNASILGDSHETQRSKLSHQRLPLSPLINDSHYTIHQINKDNTFHPTNEYLCQAPATEIMSVAHLPSAPSLIKNAALISVMEENPIHEVHTRASKHSILHTIPIEFGELSSIAEVSQAEILGEREEHVKFINNNDTVYSSYPFSSVSGGHGKVAVAIQTVRPERPPTVDAYQQTGEDLFYDSASQTDT